MRKGFTHGLLGRVIELSLVSELDESSLVVGNSDVWGMQCFCSVVSKMVSEQHYKNTPSPNI